MMINLRTPDPIIFFLRWDITFSENKKGKSENWDGFLHSGPATLSIFEYTFHQNDLFLSETLSYDEVYLCFSEMQLVFSASLQERGKVVHLQSSLKTVYFIAIYVCTNEHCWFFCTNLHKAVWSDSWSLNLVCDGIWSLDACHDE